MMSIRSAFFAMAAMAAAAANVFAGAARGAVEKTVSGGTGREIQAAIDAVAQEGGGRVVVSPGRYEVGSLRLRSGVELHLSEGALLLGSTRCEDYFSFPQEVCGVRPENSSRVLIYAWDEKDIAITGKGTVDCRGPAFFDHTKFAYGGNFFWAKPKCERPRMVQFVGCRGIRLEGVTFKDSPGWTMFIRLCEDIAVEGIQVLAEQRIINSDGIDFDSCRRVRVSRSRFRTGDDCLIARAIREPGKADHAVCEDLTVVDCELDSACQCVRMGCPSDDTIRNVVFRNVKCRGCNGIYFNNPVAFLHPGDEGFMDIRNCTFENFTGEFTGSAIQIDAEAGVKLRAVRDITFRNFDVKSARPLRFVGNVHTRFENVVFDNVKVNGVRQKDGEVSGDYTEAGPLKRTYTSWETRGLRRVDANVPPAVYRELAAFGIRGDVVPLVIAHPMAKDLIARGLTNLQNAPADRDAWSIVRDGGTTYLLGSSPRGVMQAAWELILASGDQACWRERHGEFAFRYRIHAAFNNGAISVADNPAALRDAMRYLSFSGASHVAPVCDWAGDANKSFFNYVDSEIFPKAASAGAPGTPQDRAARRRRLRAVVDAAKDYGLGVLFETILMPADTVYGKADAAEACKHYMTEHFGADVLGYMGAYQPWGLCISHPKVRAFYREVTAKFLAAFPEIELIHSITLDAGGDFCELGKCARCGGMTKAEQLDRALTLLYAAATNANPRVKVVKSGFDWERNRHYGDGFVDRQAALPAGIGYSAAAVTDPASYDRQCHGRLLHARDVTARAGQLFIGREAFYRFDNECQAIRDLVEDYPLGMYEKVARWANVGADGYYDVRGRANGEIYLNGLFLRDALQHPYDDGVAFAARTGERLFGRADKAIAPVWMKLNEAQRILSSTFAFPSASRVTQYFPWAMDRMVTPLPGEGKFASPDKLGWYAGEELPFAAANGWEHFGGTYPERLVAAGRSMREAAKLLAAAAAELPTAEGGDAEAPIELRALMGLGFRWDRKRYLDRFGRYLASGGRLYRVVGDYLILFGKCLSAGCDKAKYLASAKGDLVDFMEALRALDDYLDGEARAGRLNRTGGLAKEKFAQMLQKLAAELLFVRIKDPSEASAENVKQLADARAKFAADDPSKNVYGWADAAKADWKAFFEAIPHDGTDAEHKAFYTDRYFEETK